MAFFLNYDANKGLSINMHCKAGASIGDIGDLLKAYQDQTENVACGLEGAKNALEEGFYLAQLSGSQETVEAVHAFIVENEWYIELAPKVHF